MGTVFRLPRHMHWLFELSSKPTPTKICHPLINLKNATLSEIPAAGRPEPWVSATRGPGGVPIWYPWEIVTWQVRLDRTPDIFPPLPPYNFPPRHLQGKTEDIFGRTRSPDNFGGDNFRGRRRYVEAKMNWYVVSPDDLNKWNRTVFVCQFVHLN